MEDRKIIIPIRQDIPLREVVSLINLLSVCLKSNLYIKIMASGDLEIKKLYNDDKQ